MSHVTVVSPPPGCSVKSTTLWPSNGLMKSSWILTLEGDEASVISIRPEPTSRLPSHAYTAPLPLGAPLNVRFNAGSFFSQGDQDVQLWKSAISGKIFSGDALMLALR